MLVLLPTTTLLQAPLRSTAARRLFSSPAATMATATAAAKDFLTFVNSSPTPYHVVQNAKARLNRAGYEEIRERDSWASSVKPGGKYYLSRNASSLVAFAVGNAWRPGNPIAMVGTHTDSCCLRLKPVSKKQSDGFLQVGVETYGGGLWHTWFDRDLSIAGRLMVRTSDSTIVSKLVKINKPLLRIPTLAIHLNRTDDAFTFNKESELFPIAGMVAAELDRQGAGSKGDSKDTKDAATKTQGPLKAMTERHHPYVLELAAKEAGVSVGDICDFELLLYDTQDGVIAGLNDELIFAARLDNQGMTFCAIEGLISSTASKSSLQNDATIRLISLFDHEEIGSQSAQGAESPLLPAVIRRLSVLPGTSSENQSDDSYDKVQSSTDDIATAYEQTLATSFLLSADMAHSVHPNYSSKHESDARPLLNQGPVIKVNANQRYMTNSPGIVLIEECARRAKPAETSGRGTENVEGLPLQFIVSRNDMRCGSTIGPISAAKLGTRTLDLGNPQLSMHSIRETGGVYDIQLAINLFESFFVHYNELEKKIIVD